MRIGTPTRDTQSLVSQSSGENPGVGHDLMLKLAELLGLCQAKGGGHGGKLVHMRPALYPREHGTVDPLGQIWIGSDHTGSPRAAERLMGREGEDIGEPQGSGVSTGDDHARHMGDVSQQVRARAIRNLPELSPVGLAGERCVAGNDQLGTVLHRKGLDLVVVQQFGALVDPVGDGVVQPPGDVDVAAVGKMSTVDQGEAHDGIARLEKSLLDR